MSTIQVHSDLFSDAQLQQRVIGFLASRGIWPSGSLRVVVRRSIAYLSGRSDDPRAAVRLENACRRVAGVLDVDVSALAVLPRHVNRLDRRRAATRQFSAPADASRPRVNESATIRV